ncbi:MAG: hypothetical protein QOF51_4154 [Chloroflexota bacterium]|nr:hypothetical protein [Chloroflexota bacterium]
MISIVMNHCAMHAQSVHAGAAAQSFSGNSRWYTEARASES